MLNEDVLIDWCFTTQQVQTLGFLTTQTVLEYEGPPAAPRNLRRAVSFRPSGLCIPQYPRYFLLFNVLTLYLNTTYLLHFIICTSLSFKLSPNTSPETKIFCTESTIKLLINFVYRTSTYNIHQINQHFPNFAIRTAELMYMVVY